MTYMYMYMYMYPNTRSPVCALGSGRLVTHWYGHMSMFTGCRVPSVNRTFVSCTCTIPFAPWKEEGKREKKIEQAEKYMYSVHVHMYTYVKHREYDSIPNPWQSSRGYQHYAI